jgi:hypothetical protein
MSDVKLVSQNEGIYRLLMEINNRIAGVESAQKNFAVNLGELQAEFESYKIWTQRMLYSVVVLMIIGALILLVLIIIGRI